MTGYLGLGSNVGDRLANLRRAVALLAAREEIEVTAVSAAYETEPQGEVTDQPDFLNACLEIETALAPPELLDICKTVEQEVGRGERGPRHGPREIDVDLLLLGGIQLETGRLTLPHPEITKRRFVLVPLLELAPELTLPEGTVLRDALRALRGQRVERFPAPLS